MALALKVVSSSLASITVAVDPDDYRVPPAP
jgi:hypothetical protein